MPETAHPSRSGDMPAPLTVVAMSVAWTLLLLMLAFATFEGDIRPHFAGALGFLGLGLAVVLTRLDLALARGERIRIESHWGGLGGGLGGWSLSPALVYLLATVVLSSAFGGVAYLQDADAKARAVDEITAQTLALSQGANGTVDIEITPPPPATEDTP